MNPRLHALFTKALNIGRKTKDQQDFPEYNSFAVTPDHVSAMRITFVNDGGEYHSASPDAVGFDAKRIEMIMNPKTNEDAHSTLYPRKRLIEILQSFNSDAVEICMFGDCYPLGVKGWIVVNKEHFATIESVTAPIIPNDEVDG